MNKINSAKRVKTPTVLQMEALECGAASLAMILAYYHKYVSLELLRIECGVSRDGTKAINIIKAARKFGLEAQGYKLDIDELKEADLPAIIFWNFNHFVVFEGFKGKFAVLNDPAVGRRYVEEEEFSDSYTGVVLCFEKTENFKPSGTKPTIWPKLKKRLSGLGSILTYLSLLSIVLFIPGFIYPSFSRIFIDSIVVKNSMSLLKPLLVAMAFTSIINVFMSFVQNRVLMRFQTRLALSSASKFIDHILKMPSQFFVQRLPGELCSRISSSDSVSGFISGQLIGVAINLVAGVFFLILMFVYDVPLSIISIVLTCLLAVIYKLTSEKIKNKSFKIQMEAGKLSGITMSGIEMIESLKASGSENDFFMQWTGQQSKVILESQKLAKINTSNSVLPSVISAIQGILILTVGAIRVMDGHLSIGMLIAFQTVMSGFQGPVNTFLGLSKDLLSTNADMQRIDDVMDYPEPKFFKDQLEETKSHEDYKPISKLEGYISFKNVVFGYSPLAAPLLNDFSLELTPGKRIALVGATGSGKSTIGKLASALYAPWEGQILFDGKPLSEIRKAAFYSSVAVVDQNISLFEGTIKDNITMWNTTIPDEVYIQAAKDACVHDIITARPNGYFSKVTEGGKNFSGGQRQRLEIARALAINPRILIMDEATSALDAITEMTVDQNIRKRGCTCIIIAHRLSTIRDCDEIIVLEKGKVVQRGTHDQLISVDGYYQKLIKTM